ncbi:hypothetical protein HELRODRAFT_171479 [Helobdella robusta]|uniref:MULE transposase domain-containing protein n=1 Tax=Helobdella robusta TaxID=6412 RepID=T1F4C4_HELRO|nr:hypothetical protein HELRODRAFT_171479 [Helobdella robusta]ESO05805.1 hypothetical protein HELRODRAFT_171479 [Helobdella robusta]
MKCSTDLIYEQVELSTVSITPAITVGEEIVPSHSQVTALVEDNLVFEMNVDRHESLNVYDVEPAALDNDTCSDSDSASFTDQELDANKIWTKNLQKTEISFRLEGYCKFTGCAITFKIIISDEDLLDAHVQFSGITRIHKLSEIMARPVRASKRGEIASSMKNISPHQKHLDCIKELCPEHPNEMESLRLLKEDFEKQHESYACLQYIFTEPSSVMLWSKESLKILRQRCIDDVVYIDATGSIVKKRKHPFYIYEMVVRSSMKGGSPFPVATYLTNLHSTASILSFLNFLYSDYCKLFGKSSRVSPRYFICDGSIVLLQALARTFCYELLESVMERYYRIVVGHGNTKDFQKPIIHRSLSHIMKNAKVLFLKNIPKNFTFAMYLIGRVANVTIINELNSILISMEGVFGSEFEGPQVTQYLLQLQQAIKDNEFDLEENGATTTTELAETSGSLEKRKQRKKGIYVSNPKKPLILIKDKIQENQSLVTKPVTHIQQQPIILNSFWSDLQGTSWLSSDHIKLAMFILSLQYPHIDGLSDTDFLTHIGLNSNLPTPHGKFIQILNKGGNHWITRRTLPTESKPKNIEINLYCTCRLNHIPQKTGVKENMITCDRCGECDLEEVREEGRQFQIRGPEKTKADLAKECQTEKTKKLLEKEDWRSAHIGFIP